jgi:hypothetical protein
VDAELQKEIKAMEKRLEAKVPYACILLRMYPPPHMTPRGQGTVRMYPPLHMIYMLQKCISIPTKCWAKNPSQRSSDAIGIDVIRQDEN